MTTRTTVAGEHDNGTRKVMKTIIRRLHRLEEERYGTAADIESTRRLREALEAGRRRVAEARERGELGPPPSGPLFESRRQRLLEATANANRRSRSGVR